MSLTDPSQGTDDESLEWADVLLWWGHEKHDEVTDETVDAGRFGVQLIAMCRKRSTRTSRPAASRCSAGGTRRNDVAAGRNDSGPRFFRSWPL